MPSKFIAYKRRIKELIYLNPVVRLFYLPFLKTPRHKTYIFVLGCYNSGTTLLNELIGYHPEISMLDTEGIYLTPELIKPEQLGWNRMYYKCYEKMQVPVGSAEKIFRRVKKDWGFWHDTNKTTFIEKSIANAIWIEWLENYFDNAYFVWIIRNGYAVAEGIRRRTKGRIRQPFPGNIYPIDMCAQQWVFSNQIIEKKLKAVKNKYFLTYEELTDNPEKTMKELVEWLPVNEKQLELLPSFQFHDQSSPIRNMNRDSIQRLSGQDISAIDTVASEQLNKYNYTANIG